MAASYPQDWESTAVLQDGSTVRVRPIRPDDRDRLAAFHRRQSPESIYFRFFQHRPELSDRDLEFFTNVDYQRRMAFVAELGEQLVAVARYETSTVENSAEVAFFVDDDFHGRGLATLMLEYLAAAGRRQGLDGFTASVLPENYGMLRVFRRAGFDVSTGFEDGAIAVTLGIEVTEATDQAIRDRERVAHARSVARLLRPQSVAVVGASRHSGRVGHRLLQDLIDAPFAGAVHVVNPAGGEIAGLESLTSVSDLPPAVDLAIVVAPADAVEQIVDDCVANDVGGLLVITAGFGEIDDIGAEVERRLVERARTAGARLIGPNAFGLANTAPDVNLRALFHPVNVVAGSVGLLSQSGPLGAALLRVFAGGGVGISTFVAVGNRADVSVNDLLHYWAEDDQTSVIALYLENVGNVAKFTRIARSLSPHKPIVSVRPADPGLHELMRQSGVLIVDEVAELVEQTGLAACQPLPAGRRVAVISNSASVSRLAVAACRTAGLEVVEAGLLEPVPSGASAEEEYERAVVSVAVRSDVDTLLLAVVPGSEMPAVEMAQLFRRIDRAVDKPMVVTGLTGVSAVDVPGLPVFDFPDRAARCLGRWSEYSEWVRRDRGSAIQLDNDVEIETLVDRLLGTEGRVRLETPAAGELLDVIGVPLAPAVSCLDLSSVVDAAQSLGYPVALKAGGVSERVAGESGGAALDLHDDEALGAAFQRMEAQLGSEMFPAVVQSMVRSGAHLRVVLTQEPGSGAHLSLGYGGQAAAGSARQAVQVLPAGENEIADLASVEWLDNTSDVDRAALGRLLRSLAGAAGLIPGLQRVELNPVLLSPDGAVAVEATVDLRRVEQDPLAEVRHLG